MNKKLLFLFCLIISYPNYSYSLVPGSQLWYSGFNAGIAKQGFGGIASKNSGYYSFINPATSATTENIRFFSSGNLSPSYNDSNDSLEGGASFGFSTPIAPGGVFYTGAQYLSFGETAYTQIGYGKKVRSDLAFGIEGLLTIHPFAQQNNVGGGFTLGVLWLPQDFLPINNGWGFADFSLGGVFKTIFYPTAETCFNSIPEVLFQIGIEATFMKYQYAQWKFILDYSLGFVPLSTFNLIHLQTWASFGTTWTFWNIWDISVGAILGNNGLGVGSNKLLPYTLGTALGYEWSHFSFKLSYAFAGQEFFNKTEYLHTIGLELGIGSKRSTNMKAVLSTIDHENLTNYFSPNNDLIQDFITFTPKVVGSLPINAWRISIFDSIGRVVRSFEDDTITVDNNYTIGTFFVNYFVPTKSHNMPTTINWNGTDNNSRVLPEGTYFALLHIKYNENQNSISATNTIIIDTTKPSAEITIKDKFIYLGDDPTLALTITQELSSQDPWSAELIDNENNKKIEQWFWKQGKSPTKLSWQLPNSKRITVASGDFSYLVKSYDKAGNFNEQRVSNIIIETTTRNPKINSPYLKFSSNNDDYLDFINIDIEYTGILGLTKSCLVVYSQDGEKVYSYQQDISNIAPSLEWKGLHNDNTKAKDGDYLIILEQYYADGQQINTPPLIVTLDTTPPSFTVQFSPKRFSPDGDGIDDVLKIDFSSEDVHNISNWTILIKNEKNEILQQFEEKKAGKVLFWYPTSPLQSTDLLTFELEIQDTLGNRLSTPFHSLKVDILTDPEEIGLITTKTVAYFDEGFGVLAGDLFPYLEEIWEYYQYNPQDKIKVLAQAYHKEAENSQTEAYKLGITRANAIKEYLINKGVNPQNIEVEIQVYDEKEPKKQKNLRQAKIYLQKIPL